MTRIAIVAGIVAWGLLTAVLWGVVGTVTSTTLPPTVIEALEARFPGTVIEKARLARRRGQTVYEITGRQPELRYPMRELKLLVDAAGRFLRVERSLENLELPVPVARTVQNRYPEGNIRTATEISTGEKFVWYRVALTTAWHESLRMDCSPRGGILGVERGS